MHFLNQLIVEGTTNTILPKAETFLNSEEVGPHVQRVQNQWVCWLFYLYG